MGLEATNLQPLDYTNETLSANKGPGSIVNGTTDSKDHGTRRVTMQVSVRVPKSPAAQPEHSDYEDLPEYSLFVLSKTNPIRRAALWIITNKYFDGFILLMILANCVELALYSHRPDFHETKLAEVLDFAEYIFLAVFGTEMVLKIIAMGFITEPGSYLRSGWNVLDCAVVVLGVVDAAMVGPSYSALRAVRVLRPLRTITHIKGLRIPVVTLLHSIPQLVDVGILFGFALLIFGIVGVQMFAGVLQNRCAPADFTHAVLVPSSQGSSSMVYSNVSYLQPFGQGQLCSGYLSSQISWSPASSSSNSNSPVWSGGQKGGGFVCPANPNPAAGAPYGMFCAPFNNPNNGMTSFDNVLWAWVTIFQCITQEGWTDVMYAMWDALSPGTLVYFVILVIFGSFFLINLALAVLYLQFTKEYSVTPAVSRSVSFAAGSLSQKQQLFPDDSSFQLDLPPPGQRSADDYDDDEAMEVSPYAPSPVTAGAGAQSRRNSHVGFLHGNHSIRLPQLEHPDKDPAYGNAAEAATNNTDSAADAEGELGGTGGYVTAHVIVGGAPPAAAADVDVDGKQLRRTRSIMKHQNSLVPSLDESIDTNQDQRQRWSLGDAWASFRQFCKDVVHNGWFGLLNILVILANTGIMATTSYPMNPDWAAASEQINMAFSVYFAVELLLKLTALGPRAYIKDKMNQFDALVVLASLVELVMMLVPGVDAMSSLSVLRTARLMRVFKLARSWQELNRIITTILRSFGQVMYLSLLVLLFVFVFALMGMQLFGFKFAACSVPGAQGVCPPVIEHCPVYPDCYVPCDAGAVFTWVSVPGSPYNNLGYCEQFPRNSSYLGNATAAAAADALASPGSFQYWAQVGKAVVPTSRFDNIGWALLTVFQLVTTENWNNVMYNAMTAMNPAISLWFIAAIVIGNYILLNLFLAILLENFATPSSGSDGSGSRTSRTLSNGSTMAAAAKAAMLYDWIQDLLDFSWVAKRLQRTNKVHAVSRRTSSGYWDEDASQHQDLDMSHHSLGFGARTKSKELGHLGGAGNGNVNKQLALQDAAGNPFAEPPDASHRFSALIAPPKSSNNLLSQLMGNKLASFTSANRASSFAIPNRTGSFAMPNRASSVMLPKGQLAGPVLDVQRSSYSTTLLQGNVDLLLARPSAAQPAGTGQSHAILPGQRFNMIGTSRLQQQSAAADSRGNMPHVASSGTALDEMGHSGRTSMRGGASGQWDGANTSRSTLEGYSFGILGPQNWLRLKLQQLLAHPHFENTILLLILLSSLTLALQMPSLDRHGIMYAVLEDMDMAFVVLFALEAVIKALVKGFLFNGEGSYLRNPWNMLDFLIVVIGVLMMAVTLAGADVHALSSLRALRTLRALRPLRVASRLEGMKVVVNALFASLPPLGNVLLVCMLFYLIFGIMGVHLLAGMLYSCKDSQGNLYDASYVLPPGQHITRDWCENASIQVTTSEYHSAINVTLPAYTPDRRWVNSIMNFDNVLQAALTLFQISTTELWVDTMYRGLAAVGIDQQPRDGASPALAMFFVVFIVFGGFFVLQLFVATTIEKFAEMEQKQKKGIMLTARQQEWLAIQRLMADAELTAQHLPPENSVWRLPVFKVVMSQYCEFFILVVIVANVVFLTLTHADMDEHWQHFLSYSNIVFTAIFTLEALLKIIAIGPWAYLRDGWCQFDLFVVAVSIVGVVIDMGTSQNLQFLPLIRVMRVARVFRLIPKAQGLRTLLQTLVFSLPALGNVGSVLFLFFFIYAVVGMNLFGGVKYGAYLSEKANFSHVGIGLLTLFRMITGESWDGIMQDCMVTKGCVEVLQDVLLPSGVFSASNSPVLAAGTWLDPNDPLLSQIPAGAFTNRCSPAPIAAVVYFLSFVLLCGFVLVNFVIGVIIDNMQSSKDHDDMAVSRYHVEQFVKVWSELDPRATHYIPAVELSTLIQELPPPLGVKGEEGERAKIQSIIMSIDIPVRNTRIHFLETLHALAGRIAGTEEPESEEQKVHQKMHPHLPVNDPNDPPKYTVAHYFSALYVQAAVRGFLKRHALKGVGVQTVVLRDLPRGTYEEEEPDDGPSGSDESAE